MSLHDDTLARIQNMAIEAASAKVVPIPAENRKVLVTIGGTKELYDLPPKDRGHIALSLDSLLDCIKDHQLAQIRSSVWHAKDVVVGLFHDDDRRDRVQFNLEQSRALKAIRGLEGKALKQGDLVRLLRLDLAGAVDPMLTTNVRTLNFTGRKDSVSDMQHAKHSLGRTVEAAVSGASGLPEQFDATCEIYANCETGLQTFPIALDVDFENEAFRLSPVGDCLHRCVSAAQAAIHEQIVEALGEDALVYFGSP